MSSSQDNRQDVLAVLELAELAELVQTLPEEYREQFQTVLDRASRRIERRRRVVDFIQEALNQLRLDMKYLMFDLNATKIERDQYKQKLEK